jgi:hypothetical protein
MTYRAIPLCTTKYSPFYLLHDREMNFPNPQDLKPKISQDVRNPDQVQRLEDIKYSKAKTYEVVKHNIRKSHQINKFWYDRKAKDIQFQVGDLVYLFSPARKPGKCKILENRLGPCKITARLSDLNYRIVGQKGKERVVHINRLKKSYDQRVWHPQTQKHPFLRPAGGLMTHKTKTKSCCRDQ